MERSIYEARPGYAWWVAGIFMLAGMLSYTDRQIFNLLVDPIRQDLLVSDTQISLLQGAAFAVLYAFAGIPMGILADRYSRKIIIITGVVIWSAATILCGYSDTITELFIARILVGIGEACLAPSVISLIADYFPSSRRGMPTGLFIMGMALGIGGSIIFSGFILELYNAGYMKPLSILGDLAPWRGVLVLAGLSGVIIVALMATVIEPQRQTIKSENLDHGQKPDIKHIYAFFRRHWSLFIPLYLGLAITTVSDYATFSWAPSLLMRKFGQTPGEVAIWLGSIAIITAVVGASLGGVLMDSLGKKTGGIGKIRMAANLCIILILAASYPLYSDKITMMAFLVLYLVMAAIVGVVAITAVQDVLPSNMRGIGSAFIAFFNTIIGLGCGPTIVALCNDYIFTAHDGVSYSLSLVTLPATTAGMLLLYMAASSYRQKIPKTTEEVTI